MSPPFFFFYMSIYSFIYLFIYIHFSFSSLVKSLDFLNNRSHFFFHHYIPINTALKSVCRGIYYSQNVHMLQKVNAMERTVFECFLVLSWYYEKKKVLCELHCYKTEHSIILVRMTLLLNCVYELQNEGSHRPYITK